MTLEDFIGDYADAAQLQHAVAGDFWALALVLCTIGIYSVLAYSVKRRMREIGLRLAFGASFNDVVSLVIVQGMKPTLVGVGDRVCGSVRTGAGRGSLIYGVSVRDMATFICRDAGDRVCLVCGEPGAGAAGDEGGSADGAARGLDL